MFTKGAPEQVLERCASALTADGGAAEAMTTKARDALQTRAWRRSHAGLCAFWRWR